MCMLVARQKIPDITLFLGDIEGAFLNAFMKNGEVIIAQPPPEWKLSKLKACSSKTCLEVKEGTLRAQDIAEAVARLLW